MHALSKKLYNDVMKSGREYTILESDSSGDNNCDLEVSLTSDVGCYVRAHLKSNAIQTDLLRSNNKNFRHEYTITTAAESLAVAVGTDGLIQVGERSNSRTKSYKDAISFGRSSQSTSKGVHRHQYPLLKYREPVVVFECFDHDSMEKNKKRAQAAKRATAMDVCKHHNLCKCLQTGCNCDDFPHIPTNRGLAAYHTFTLGTLETRRFQKENSNTKLIGGCRVPVYKNNKSRY